MNNSYNFTIVLILYYNKYYKIMYRTKTYQITFLATLSFEFARLPYDYRQEIDTTRLTCLLGYRERSR